MNAMIPEILQMAMHLRTMHSLPRTTNPKEMIMSIQQSTTLILGGTGKTGRRVAERLTKRGLPVVVASRSGTPPFDWADGGTYGGVLRNVSSVYVAYAPDLA